MERGSEFTGSLEEVNQETEYVPLPIPPVRVQHDGPVQVHLVPSVSGGSRSYTVETGQVLRIGNEDPRRRSLTIISDVSFYIGAEDNEARSQYGAFWPSGVALVLTHSDQVYVKTTGAGTLSAITETWAS